MKCIIRADASVQIGSGHIIRCLTLANELKNKNVEVHFVCKEHKGHLIDFLKENKFPVYSLSLPQQSSTNSEKQITAHDFLLQDSWQNDALQTLHKIYSLGKIDWLIVDHYALEEKWETALRPFVKKIFVIDDLADRKHNADLLLDQNFHINNNHRYKKLVPETCKLLPGPEYALLRPQFHKLRQNLAPKNFPPKEILIFFGSSDPSGLTTKAIQALQKLNQDHEFTTHIIIGQISSCKEKVLHAAQNLKNSIVYDRFIAIENVMVKCDFFIGAGGSTTWERCCLGLPSLIITTADNQMSFSEELAQANAQIHLGYYEKITTDQIFESCKKLFQDKEKFFQISQNALQICDGLGVKKVARELLR